VRTCAVALRGRVGDRSWCRAAGLLALPAEPTTAGAYLTDRAGSLKVATLNHRIAAITAAHRTGGQGLDGGHPAIARVLAGIRRRYGTRQAAKTAILTEDLRRISRGGVLRSWSRSTSCTWVGAIRWCQGTSCLSGTFGPRAFDSATSSKTHFGTMIVSA
jgi:hypothetical protein